ncbi:AraC family transcriptional regulator [Inhella gelatinilytica]|uniref:AraC family transcriptional regulator n=1 Tax=Inhella gelatinilytica TaxID=2795030 RepID=A0A931N9N0_9BURK|nr:helix-turn-helix domain-containing protein [Inhella gelatinilytica]MBH9551538.1 AraC family transcriptional regulator [Inhella gelatinilytica]
MIDSLMGLLAVQSLLLAAWLLSQRLMLPLAAWLGVLALHMGANLAAPALGLTGLTQSLGLLHGPLLWLWVRHLVRAQALGAPAAVHLLPAALPPVAAGLGLQPPWALVAALQFFAYWSAALWALHRQRQQAAQLRAHAGADLRWLLALLWVLAGIAVLDALRLPLRALDLPGAAALQGLSLAGLLGCVYVLLWQGLRQPLRISALRVEELQALAPAPPPAPEGSDQERLRWQTLLVRWQQEKPFLDPELSLTALATLWQENPRQLSQRIQQFAPAPHFRDFVNRARVEWVCDQLAQGRRDKLLTLQLEAGFNSKSVFNEAFKRYTGTSPSAYRAQVQGPET